MELYKSECYCTNTRRISGILTGYYDDVLKDSHLTITQYYLLINLERLDGANITHWATRVGLERSTMVRNIKVLEKNGWIEQVEGHGKVYVLSKEGKACLEQAKILWDKAQKNLEEIIGKEDVETLLRVTRKIQENFN